MFSGNQASFLKALNTLGTYEEFSVPQAKGAYVAGYAVLRIRTQLRF